MTLILFALFCFNEGCCSQSRHYSESNTMLRFAIIAVCIALSAADYDKKIGYGGTGYGYGQGYGYRQGYGYGLNNLYVPLPL